MTIRYIDLFAGIGGFHAAGSAFGWECVFASEIDSSAAAIYEINWKQKPLGDIQEYTQGETKNQIPEHDVLFAGFPCQPFSKSGKQLGMEEVRGSLFHDIAYVIKKHKPSLVVLENVRNLAGPRHIHEWKLIISKLRELGYRVSSQPFIVSPHRIPPRFGGTPQARERVFIVATRLPSKKHALRDSDDQLQFPTEFDTWTPNSWNLFQDLPIRNSKQDFMKYRLTPDEVAILDAWDWLNLNFRSQGNSLRLPGFPLWSDLWGKNPIYIRDRKSPIWKKDFENKNISFYLENKNLINEWLKLFPIVRNSAPSKRKFEWQAQDLDSLWDGLIHFRPSGIRVKRPNYVPALVAITQTTIIGRYRRRLTPLEAAQLQGLPGNFNFGTQTDAMSYKQLGNGVSVGAIYQVIKAAVNRDEEILKVTNPKLLRSVKRAPMAPVVEKGNARTSKVTKVS